jgi:hypothetical protein
LREFKARAQQDEDGAYKHVLSHIRGDLTETEKQIIREEIDAKNNMILMIFRFYL